jgi:FixJ family two-component response regulator
MDETSGTVFIVDDDADVRDGVSRLLRAAGIDAVGFASPHEFLAATRSPGVGCIILDVAMPVMSGPELHAQLAALGIDYPVIYLTGTATVAISVEAMKSGAVDFLEKPFDFGRLVATVEKALADHRERRAAKDREADIRKRYAELSRRESEIMRHVIRGRLNKQIASDLGITLKTVKGHRGHMMAKMKVRSVAELVRLCDLTGIANADWT